MTMTHQAEESLLRSKYILGYDRYLNLLRQSFGSRLPDEKYIETGSQMMGEVERVEESIRLARDDGHEVAIVSSGDAGVYGMSSLVLEMLSRSPGVVEVEVIPGVTASLSAAALVGAPLGHDFATISLSDLLTEKEVIVSRVDSAAKAVCIGVL
jgi:precorrin-3B C17-methyltransferase